MRPNSKMSSILGRRITLSRKHLPKLQNIQLNLKVTDGMKNEFVNKARLANVQNSNPFY